MKKPILAITIPCYNEELCIENTVNSLFEVLDDLIKKDKIDLSSFIYLVDDGSTDKTWEIISKLHNKHARVRGLKFIRNYGNQKAHIAGLLGVRKLCCDCVVSIDADLQQDQWAIEKFIDKFMQGYDIVSGIRNSRDTDTFWKKTTAICFYKTMNLLGVKIPMNHSDFRLVSKKALDILAQYPENEIFLRGFFNEVGLKSSIVNFDVKPREQGESKFNYMTLFALALNGITSFSIMPLRIIAAVGFLMALFAVGLGLEVIYEKVILDSTPNGWATLVILLAFFGGLQLFCMGIIGEYVGQVFKEVKARPRYIIETELI